MLSRAACTAMSSGCHLCTSCCLVSAGGGAGVDGPGGAGSTGTMKDVVRGLPSQGLAVLASAASDAPQSSNELFAGLEGTHQLIEAQADIRAGLLIHICRAAASGYSRHSSQKRIYSTLCCETTDCKL